MRLSMFALSGRTSYSFLQDRKACENVVMFPECQARAHNSCPRCQASIECDHRPSLKVDGQGLSGLISPGLMSITVVAPVPEDIPLTTTNVLLEK